MPSVGTDAVVQEIKINAKPETVFAFLVDPAKVRRWMSIGGDWQPVPGKPYRLEMTKEDIAVGAFVEVDPPRRLVLTWGWEGQHAKGWEYFLGRLQIVASGGDPGPDKFQD